MFLIKVNETCKCQRKEINKNKKELRLLHVENFVTKTCKKMNVL